VRVKLGLFALVTGIFTIGFAGFARVHPASDINTHISYADQIGSPADLTSPHFLFQLLLKVVHEAGVDYSTAAVWLLGLCYGAMAVLIAREIERRGGMLTTRRAYLLVPGLLVASHVFLLTVLRPNLYYGYFVPIAYHNPTQQLNKLFTLAIYFLYCAHFLENPRPASSRAAGIGSLCVLSALAKPSFLVAFVPTAGLQAIRDLFRRRYRHVVLFAFAIVLPCAAVLLWQVRVAYGSSPQAGLAFAPFAVFSFEETLYKLPASLAFPLVAGAGALATGQADARLRFVWLFTLIAMFATLFLAESGARLMDGNFAWTGQTAVFLAYVESAIVLLVAPIDRRWRRAAWSVFLVHVACGIVWFATMFFPARQYWL